ncbi:Hypothetical predicted protein [Drosophila guanche]|uniref:Uncharacterized protein n=1 Tax=Drosophila guanche TaxID=7266 RepID=A0A3B0J9G2_DROGU|nr:Hypothetical predicted protein [Drosophila guanche]
MRRQRSAEWHSHRHGHGYGSSSDDEYQNTAQPATFDTQLLAQLLLQSQQLASMEHYNSDCKPEYLRQRDRRLGGGGPVTAVPGQAVTYAQPHQGTTGSPLELATVSTSEYQSNANLGLFPSSSATSTATDTAAAASTAVAIPRSTNPFLSDKFTADDESTGTVLLPASASSSTAASSRSRSPRSSGAARSTLNRLSGMTSSSSGASALSVNRSDSLRQRHPSQSHSQAQHSHPNQVSGVSGDADGNGEGDFDDFSGISGESEPPQDPGPPEIPPRTQSLLMSLRKHSDYRLKYEEKGDQKHEEFIPTVKLQKRVCLLLVSHVRVHQPCNPCQAEQQREEHKEMVFFAFVMLILILIIEDCTLCSHHRSFRAHSFA